MFTFFAIAFGLAWALQIPVYAFGLDGPVAFILVSLAAFAPSVAGLVASRGAVWRDLVRGPRPVWAILTGLVGPSLLSGVAGLAAGTLVASPPNVMAVLGPPIGEELGWRGYLQPKLRSSAAVGLIWALWHAPTAFGHWETFPPFVAQVVLVSILIGFLWEKSGRSVLVAVAAHAGVNLGIISGGSQTATLILYGVAAAAVMLAQLRGGEPTKRSPPRRRWYRDT